VLSEEVPWLLLPSLLSLEVLLSLLVELSPLLVLLLSTGMPPLLLLCLTSSCCPATCLVAAPATTMP
jgi:hypothetical protein